MNNSSPSTLIIVLISGGGSALMPLPAPGLNLEDLQKTTELLLSCGASIHEINCVRKHLSSFKGGQLARVLFPRISYNLIISDVVGNDLQTIASGPTSPDNTTFEMASEICKKYGVFEHLPKKIRDHIISGTGGKIAETPKSEDSVFTHAHNIIIGSAIESAQTVRKVLEYAKIPSTILSHRLSGEAKQYGGNLPQLLNELKITENPSGFIITGEMTVTLQGNGVGGRNQEMLLAFLHEIYSSRLKISENLRYVVIAGAFDGIEGNSSAMGAIVDSSSIHRCKKQGLIPDFYLRNNDSYNFFSALGDVIITGQTGTNVNDMIIILLENFI